MYDPVLIAAILIMQVSQWTSPIIPGLQQTMFIPRESVSTSPSKTGSPGKAKPISSCQGIIGIHKQRCCIRSYQRISTARNCSSISIKHHQELLKLRGPLSCLMFLIIWLDQATSTLTNTYIESIIIYEASAYCSTKYESPNKSPWQSRWPSPPHRLWSWPGLTPSSDPGWPACPANTLTTPMADTVALRSLSLCASILQISCSIPVRA